MSGTPSRDTFDPAKQYREVQYVGGTDRRLFDFELNETQQILRQLLRDANGGIVSDSGLAKRLGRAGRVHVTGNPANTVSVSHGYVMIGNDVYCTKMGSDGVVDANPESVVLFDNADVATDTVFLYFDISFDIVDGDDDSELVDPTYGLDTAQRTKVLVSIGTSLNTGAISPPSGHLYIPIAIITKGTNGAATIGLPNIAYFPNMLRSLTDIAPMFTALASYLGVTADVDGEPDWAGFAGTGPGGSGTTSNTLVVWLPSNTGPSTTRTHATSDVSLSKTGAVSLPGTIPPTAKAVLMQVHVEVYDANSGVNDAMTFTLTSSSGNSSEAKQWIGQILGYSSVPHIPITPKFTAQMWMDYGTFTLDTVKEGAGCGYYIRVTPLAYIA
jgi:hypothetical protein